MDQVTQRTAAGESNAQSEALKGVVERLSAMVDGEAAW
jgi:hypothetical protein